MKYCLGYKNDGHGHEVDFFPGLYCPECDELRRLSRAEAEMRACHIEALRENYLRNHPDVAYRAERDGGFGA